MKKNAKIKVRSYAKRTDGSLVPIDDLGELEKREFATSTAVAFLNELYSGRAKFFKEDSAPSGATYIGKAKMISEAMTF